MSSQRPAPDAPRLQFLSQPPEPHLPRQHTHNQHKIHAVFQLPLEKLQCLCRIPVTNGIQPLKIMEIAKIRKTPAKDAPG